MYVLYNIMEKGRFGVYLSQHTTKQRAHRVCRALCEAYPLSNFYVVEIREGDYDPITDRFTDPLVTQL